MYTKIRSKRSSEVHKVGKLYVGLLEQLPPPRAVQEKWDQIRPDLEDCLCEATKMLSKSMRDEEVITELVLCMAGKKCPPTSAPLEPDPVALHPTIWIYCGSRKCKKKVLEAIPKVGHLQRFRLDFDIAEPHASLHAPWPAAEEHLSESLPLEGGFDNVSFAIQESASSLTTTCGARAKFTIRTSNGVIQRFSTIGGLIIVGDSLYAMTTAHAIVNCWLERARVSSDESGPSNGVSSGTDSDIETSSDSGADTSENIRPSSLVQLKSTAKPPEEAKEIQEPQGIWTDSQRPMILAYLDRRTTSDDYSFPVSEPTTADFALVDPQSFMQLSNQYRDPKHNTIETISDHILTNNLVGGEVWIITSGRDAPLKGYMLEGDASIILRGAVMRTKKIQIDSPLPGSLPYTVH
jgi:hypothetical protein